MFSFSQLTVVNAESFARKDIGILIYFEMCLEGRGFAPTKKTTWRLPPHLICHRL